MLLHNGYRRIPQTPGSRLHRTDGCLAPASIAAAVYSGYRFARDLSESPPDDTKAKVDERGLNITSTAITDVEVDDETKRDVNFIPEFDQYVHI